MALHLVEQDIKYVPAAGELRAEGVDSRRTSLVHFLHTLSAFPLSAFLALPHPRLHVWMSVCEVGHLMSPQGTCPQPSVLTLKTPLVV